MKPTTVLLSLLLLAGTCGAARAQLVAPGAARTAQFTGQAAKGYCLMKDGNVLLVKNGETAPMTATLIMGDGSLCKPDGTCQRKDGTIVHLKEGQSMLMNGKITRHPDENPGPHMHHPKK